MSAAAGVKELLDRATAAREVAIMTALTLMRTEGDPEAALALLDECRALPDVEAQGDELDALSISAQAIRDAMRIKAGGDL